ncbi:NAD dependent epimerase/dehydratase family protein-like protein [Periconia macrospinosa]|uniref:NAD dependent epimerase/dehydratase family protein-like protein n=1 Tax=Periconia macrospinosa TaxID=97972 RepID=A0A2V1DLS7_9PLEO|nr:NAD dependent epimerase/dehydratase family protein-like protein [Periconia macrospinosa]
MTTAAIVGSTGFVGSNILSQLLAHPGFSSVYAFARRDPPNPTNSTKLTPITSTDNTTWVSQYPRSASPKVFFSALGSTRATAGGLENQRKLDVDLNYALAQAAKEAGADTYVLISSASASAASRFPYMAMKGELEDKVQALGFKHTVILRPGLIMGSREESRPAEAVIRGIAGVLKSVSPSLTNFWGQDAAVIARAAVNAGKLCSDGEKEEGTWILGQGDIVTLGAEEKK